MKEHKIVVTRDRGFGRIKFWKYPAYKILKMTDGHWYVHPRLFIIGICRSCIVKQCLGFTPKPSSKQVIIIKRAK